MSKLFGLPMPKAGKVTVLLALPAATVCLVIYLLCVAFEPAHVEVTSLPESGLSDSIFDAQNMLYASVDGLNVKREFSMIPYTIDVVEGKCAVVNKGVIYESGAYRLYVSESEGGVSTTEKLKQELTSVLSINASSANTTVSYLLEESGYKNGCYAEYSVSEIMTQDGVKSYLVLYRLSIDRSIYETENDIYVGCLTNQYTTKELLNARALASAQLGTLRYSKELDLK